VGSALRGTSDAFVIKLAALPDQSLIFEYSSLIGEAVRKRASLLSARATPISTDELRRRIFRQWVRSSRLWWRDSMTFVSKLQTDGKSLVLLDLSCGSGSEDRSAKLE